MSTATLVMPGPLADANVSCGTSYNRRSLSWTITEPGEWHRNAYTMAWVEVAEREAWKGEPLSLWATRRLPGHNVARSAFTDKAQETIRAEVLPVIARYGFSRLWVDLHRGKHAREADARLEQARKELEWHRQHADLQQMHLDGLVEFVPLERNLNERAPRVAIVPRYRGDAFSAAVVARAVLAGEQVGWMTEDGYLVPTEDALRG